MRRGPTTFALVLGLIALAVALALGIAAALSLGTGARFMSGTFSRLALSTALAADDLAARNDADAATTLARMQRLGLRFEAGPPPASTMRIANALARTGDSIGNLIDDPSRVVVAQTGVAEIWIRSRHDPQRWIVLQSAARRRPLFGETMLIAAVAGLIAILVAAVAARLLTRPLERLEHNAGTLLDGVAQPDLLRGSSCEVRSLAAAIGNAGERLRHAARERELMLAGVSHDLRTPLARLRLALELGDGADAQRREAMIADLEQLDETLEQCLAFVRDGRDEVPREVDLTTIAGQLLGQRTSPDDWQLSAPPTLHAKVRPTLLRRALGNLMDNAERHGAGPFTVTLWRDDGMVRIRIADHGGGVAADLLPRLGQPFLRGDSARNSRGSGLGLSIVARAAQLHGGALSLANAADGGFAAEFTLAADPEFRAVRETGLRV